MSSKLVGGRSPAKKGGGLKEQSDQRKEVELKHKAMCAVANMEHEFGKYFFEFFFSCFNLILYHRGLHSKKLFMWRESKLFEMKFPHIRFPDTLLYLEKVTQKGVNCLMSDFLEAFLFEERDRYGNTITFMFRLSGFPAITPTTLLFKEEIIAELKSSCESLLSDLSRTLKNMPPVMQANMFRWKIELGLKKVDMRNSKWKHNRKGIFINDPDWEHFPWSRNTRNKRKDNIQETGSPVRTVENAPTTSEKPNQTAEEVSTFFAGNNFEDVTLEDCIRNDAAEINVQEDYEKEGLSIIEYTDESDENRPGSPDMFPDSENILIPESSNNFHFETNPALSSEKDEPDCQTSFTLAETELDSPIMSSSSNERELDSSTEEFNDATKIFDDFDDFIYLDKVLEILEDEASLDDLDISFNTIKKGRAKCFPIATMKMLDRLLCNILAFKDIHANEANSDYNPPPPKKKSKRC